MKCERYFLRYLPTRYNSLMRWLFSCSLIANMWLNSIKITIIEMQHDSTVAIAIRIEEIGRKEYCAIIFSLSSMKTSFVLYYSNDVNGYFLPVHACFEAHCLNGVLHFNGQTRKCTKRMPFSHCNRRYAHTQTTRFDDILIGAAIGAWIFKRESIYLTSENQRLLFLVFFCLVNILLSESDMRRAHQKWK